MMFRLASTALVAFTLTEATPSITKPHSQGQKPQNESSAAVRNAPVLHSRRNSSTDEYWYCSGEEDIVFLADNSGSVGPQGRLATQDFLWTLSDHLRLSYHGGQMVGVIGWAAQPQLHTHLTDDTSKLDGAISDLQEDDPQEDLGPALVMAKSVLKFGGRVRAPASVLVLVDGHVVDQPAAEREAADVGEVSQLVAVLVGGDDAAAQSTLRWLGKSSLGGPAEQRLIRVSGWDALSMDTVVDVLHRVCPEVLMVRTRTLRGTYRSRTVERRSIESRTVERNVSGTVERHR